jgi:hypothetical protein
MGLWGRLVVPMYQHSHFFVFAQNELADVGPYVRWG